jgi:outer membrane protein assembly factor BamB
MTRRNLPLALATPMLVVALCLAPRCASADWPQFRGPQGQGHAPEARLPLRWSETEGVRWKTPLPGRGWSSPVVRAGRIWLTTAIETQATPEQIAQRRAAAAAAGTPDAGNIVARISLLAVELDAETGVLLREIPLFEVDDPPSAHALNSYASPTPVLGEDRVFCHFGAFGTACLDAATGEVLWKTSLPIEHGVGPGSTPLLWGDRLIIPCDGMDRQFVAALDVGTGQVAWQTDRPPIRSPVGDVRKAFSTPLAIEVGGQTQIVIPCAQWYVAYDPASGSERWKIDHGDGYSNVPRPVFDGERIFLCSGFTKPEVWAVTPDPEFPTAEPKLAWKYAKQAPTMASPLLVDGRFYMVSDPGIATCLDAATGKPVWQERLTGKYSASPLYADGKIYFCSREGLTTVVAAGDEFEVLAENSLEGALMASPAVLGDDLILRTDQALYRIGQPGASPEGSAGR